MIGIVGLLYFVCTGWQVEIVASDPLRGGRRVGGKETANLS
jgi:hypothetical protein